MSQFFLTLGDSLDYLDGVHTVFGEVVEGEEVLDLLNNAYCDDNHRPYKDIRSDFHSVIIFRGWWWMRWVWVLVVRVVSLTHCLPDCRMCQVVTVVSLYGDVYVIG